MTPIEKTGLGILGVLGLLGVVAFASKSGAASPKRDGAEPLPPAKGGGKVVPPVSQTGCFPQPPQDFLVRENYRRTPGGLEATFAYRTKEYGYVEGFGDPSLNATTPPENATMTTFFDIPVKLNKRVVASLRCVEAEIRATCGTGYQPKNLSGLRLKNTFLGGEVSNHMYGIALDVDPLLNPCCGCRGHWAADPRCNKQVTSEFERMDMPECWVHVFEKYGWYWLGHDALKDTMHFEFLGIPPEG